MNKALEEAIDEVVRCSVRDGMKLKLGRSLDTKIAVDQLREKIAESVILEQFIASVEGMDSPKCPCHYCASEQTRPEGA